MAEHPAPLVLINAVGLTRKWLAHAPSLAKLADAGWVRPLREVWPSVTCTAQASILTGTPPDRHGVVGNGWLFRDTREVRFWQQSNALMQAEPVYATARREASRRGRPFRAAKLFWWFNQGADVDLSATPKPYYGADGRKAFGITGTPQEFSAELEGAIGTFPFPTFWGPGSGLPSTAWIARAAAETLKRHRPDLSLVYLPHLDYEPQRRGPSGCDMPALVRELDGACRPILEAAQSIGARVWVVSEYGHCDVDRPVHLNRILRREGLLAVRDGVFGEVLETFTSRAFAVCDHQLAHVYVKDEADIPRVRERLSGEPGVARVFSGEERGELGLDHPRSGEVVAISERNSWFAYPYWLDDARAPDFARTIDIHRKPGYDPCELFFDPALRFPKAKVIRKLALKALGFRILMDVIPLNASLARGSHGIPSEDDADRPILVGDGPAPGADRVEMTGVRDLLLRALNLMPEGHSG